VPEGRQNPLSAPTIFLAWRAPAHRKLAPARDGFFDEPGLGVVLREELGLVCARGPHLRNRYDAKGGSNAVVLKLRLPNREISGQDGKLDYVSPIGGGAIRPHLSFPIRRPHPVENGIIRSAPAGRGQHGWSTGQGKMTR
jgi:hypothetical protein